MKKNKKTGLGLLMVIVLTLVGYSLYSNNGRDLKDETGIYANEELKAGRSVPVELAQVSLRDFEEKLTIQGNLESKNVAMVPSRLKGTIISIFVDEGDSVVAGKTKLFQIDALKLEKSVEVSWQALAIARCALLEEKANLEKVDADLKKAEIDYRRFKSLVVQGTVSKDQFEQVESRYKQARATYKHAKARVDLAVEQERQATASLEIAQKDLKDTLVYAPISGKVTKRYQEPGEMGDPGDAVLKIEDPSLVEVVTYLPAQYYRHVVPGKTTMSLQVYGIQLKDQPISYKSPVIDPKMRTFKVKSLVQNPPDGVVSGAMAQIEVILDQRRCLGVPREALQQRQDKMVLFVINNGKAHMVEVKTGLETDGWVELKGKSLPEKALVVIKGQFLLKEGTPVTVQKRGM